MVVFLQVYHEEYKERYGWNFDRVLATGAKLYYQQSIDSSEQCTDESVYCLVEGATSSR